MELNTLPYCVNSIGVKEKEKTAVPVLRIGGEHTRCGLYRRQPLNAGMGDLS